MNNIIQMLRGRKDEGFNNIDAKEIMKPFIHHTSFGSITVGNRTYDHDLVIRSDG